LAENDANENYWSKFENPNPFHELNSLFSEDNSNHNECTRTKYAHLLRKKLLNNDVHLNSRKIVYYLNSLDLLADDYQVEKEDLYFMVRIRDTTAEEAQNQVNIDGNVDAFESLVTKLPRPAQILVRKYKDLFPNELPKELPPKRTSNRLSGRSKATATATFIGCRNTN